MGKSKNLTVPTGLFKKLRNNYTNLTKKYDYLKVSFRKSRLAFKRLLRNYLVLKQKYIFLRKHSSTRVKQLLDTINEERYQIVFDNKRQIHKISKAFLDFIEMTREEFASSFYISVLFDKYLPSVAAGVKYTEITPFQFPMLIRNSGEQESHIHPYMYFRVFGKLLSDPKYNRYFYQLVFQDISAEVELNYFQKTDTLITSLSISNFNLTKAMKTIEMHKIMLIYLTCSLFEEYSRETSAHLQRIKEITYSLTNECRHMGLITVDDYDLEEYVKDISYTSVLHDIGKMGVPRDLLYKDGPLDEEEIKIMRKHPKVGAQYIQKILDIYKDKTDYQLYNKFLQIPYEIILYHHERWDGNGYPEGLKEEKIPIAARIVTVADTYDAIRGSRIYDKSRTHKEAVDIIINEAGKQFDPKIVEAFTHIIPLLEQLEYELVEVS